MSSPKTSLEKNAPTSDHATPARDAAHGGSLAPSPSQDEALWWLPNAVLGLLVLVGLLGFFGVFNNLLKPIAAHPAAAESHEAPAASPKGH